MVGGMKMMSIRLALFALPLALTACDNNPRNFSDGGPSYSLDTPMKADNVRDCIVAVTAGQDNVTPYQGGWLITRSGSGIIGPSFIVWSARISPTASGSHIFVQAATQTDYEDDVKPCIDRLR